MAETAVRDVEQVIGLLNGKVSVYRENPYPDDRGIDEEMPYGVTPTVFEGVVRHFFNGGKLPARMPGGGTPTIYTNNFTLYAEQIIGEGYTHILTTGPYGSTFLFSDRAMDREEVNLFRAVADTMVDEGLLNRHGNYYYRDGVEYLKVGYAGHLSQKFNEEMYEFLSSLYRAADPKNVVAARFFTRTVEIVNNQAISVNAVDDEACYQARPSGDGSLIAYQTLTRANRGSAYQDMKPARFAKYALREWAREGLTDRDYENFDIAWKAAFTISDEIVYVDGEKIRWCYDKDNHKNSEAYSCMSDKGKLHELDIFVNNPDQIKLAGIFDGLGRVVARCLIWTDDTGQKWYDRPYGSEKNMRYMEKVFQGEGMLSMQNDTRSYAARITLSNPWVKRQPPYLDTVRYMNAQGQLRREADKSDDWIAIGNESIRNGWPGCPVCNKKVPVSELGRRRGAVVIPCSECLDAAAVDPTAQRMSALDDSFNTETVTSLGNGLLAYDGGIWTYHRPTLSLVRIGDYNG